MAEIRPESDKSGAAMRAAPLGVFPTIGEVVARATAQAKLTHDTPDGINSALAAALMTHYFLYRLGPKAELGAFVARHVPGDWAQPWHGKVKSKGPMSVRAAITAIVENASMSDVLRACVAFTGDVDTVAAIALAAGSCAAEIAHDMPQHLIYGLEDGPYRTSLHRSIGRAIACARGALITSVQASSKGPSWPRAVTLSTPVTRPFSTMSAASKLLTVGQTWRGMR